MNKEQTRYATKRVYDIRNHQEDKLRDKFTDLGITLKLQEKIELIRSGEVKLFSKTKTKKLGDYTTGISSLFDFSNFEVDTVFNNKKYLAAKDKLDNRVQVIIDQIMLGDSEIAINLITSLEKASF